MQKETVSDIREHMRIHGAKHEPYSALQVAKAYGITVRTIWGHCRTKILPAKKVGKPYEIRAEGILEWRKRRTTV
jgi:hypothetical protein